MQKTKTLTPEKLILQHLKDNGQKMSWLAEKIKVTPGHLHAVLKGKGITKRDLTVENLAKINEILNTDF